MNMKLKTKSGKSYEVAMEIKKTASIIHDVKASVWGSDIISNNGKYCLRARPASFREAGIDVPASIVSDYILIEIDNVEEIKAEIAKNTQAKNYCMSCGNEVILGRNGTYKCKCGANY